MDIYTCVSESLCCIPEIPLCKSTILQYKIKIKLKKENFIGIWVRSSDFLWQWCYWLVWGGACHPTPLDLRVSSSVEKLVSMVSKTVSYSHILWVGSASTACYVFAIVFDGKEGGRKGGKKNERGKDQTGCSPERAALGSGTGFCLSSPWCPPISSFFSVSPHRGAKPQSSASGWVSWTQFLTGDSLRSYNSFPLCHF